jgi:hypothetical protein
MSIKAGVEHLHEKFTNLCGFAEFDVVSGHGTWSWDVVGRPIVCCHSSVIVGKKRLP